MHNSYLRFGIEKQATARCFVHVIVNNTMETKANILMPRCQIDLKMNFYLVHLFKLILHKLISFISSSLYLGRRCMLIVVSHLHCPRIYLVRTLTEDA